MAAADAAQVIGKILDSYHESQPKHSNLTWNTTEVNKTSSWGEQILLESRSLSQMSWLKSTDSQV